MKNDPKFNGPIPGENYTSDTRNYPWHRPPENKDFVAAVDKAIKKLNTPQGIGRIITLLDAGESILDIVAGSSRISVAEGKVGIDTAILAAGPIAKFIETVAEDAGIEYALGFKLEEDIPTPERLRAVIGGGKKKKPELVEPEATEKPVAGGLMGKSTEPTSKDEQLSMLGYGDEEIEE